MIQRLSAFMSILLLPCCAINQRENISNEAKNKLIQEISEIGILDQKFRNTATELRVKNKGVRTEEEARFWVAQASLDSMNMIRLEKIMAAYGYPGATLVGEDLKKVGVLVILHNPQKQEKYLNLLWKEAEKGNVDKREVDFLSDRIRMLKGEKQLYGTAMRYEPIGQDSLTGKLLTKLRIWDIMDFKNLDKRREKVECYSFRLQCELEGIDWRQFKEYKPERTRYDFQLDESNN